ncbi:SMP-30/gluconolactonase/LRE family protein [Flavitalea antarctica]
MKTIKATVAFKQEAVLGEGPVWDHITRQLYWVDIKSKKVFVFDPATRQHKSWLLDQMVGCIAVTSDNEIVCALQDKLVRLNTSTGDQPKLAEIEAGLPDNRCNDGKADAAGRLWVGTLHMPGEKGKAALYRVDKDCSVTKMVPGLGMSNGLAWTPDNKTMYLIDTEVKHVLSFEFSIPGGALANRQVALDLKDEEGSPDGMCIDANGNLWIAFYGGSRVACYNPETGEQLAEISVPAVNVTCCTFGGRDLDTLFITTARDGLDEDALKSYPDTGSLFMANPGVKGLPANRFITAERV